MKRRIVTTLITLATGCASMFFAQPARAVCYPVTYPHAIRNSANHPDAYSDGYREGQQSASKREEYRPRTSGGEFGRGFEDGYYGRSFTGQQSVIADRVEGSTFHNCDSSSLREWFRQKPIAPSNVYFPQHLPAWTPQSIQAPNPIVSPYPIVLPRH
jgi:hypothetical protein